MTAEPNALGRVLAYFTNAVAYAGKAFPKRAYRFDAALASMSKVGRWQTLEPEEHREAYKLAVTSAWIYSDISLIADRVSTAEAMPQVKRKVGEDLKDVGDHPYEQLLKVPNPLMTGKYLRRYIVWWLLLKGESYVFIGTPGWARGDPLELWPLPADMMRPLPGTLRKSRLTSGPIIDYEYIIPGQDPQRFPGENILHYRLPNPFNYWQGLSPLSAALLGVQTDISQAKWTRDFFGKDNAIPTAIISLPKDISEAEFALAAEMIREEFGEKRKSAIIPAGEMSVEVITQTLEQMQMIASREFNRNEIDRIYRIPEGYMGAGLSGASQLAHEIALARNAIQPLIDYLAAEETAKIGPYYGEDIVIEAPNVIPQDRALDMHEYRTYGLDRTINENRAEQDLDGWKDELGEIPIRALEALIKQQQVGGMGGPVGGLPGGSMNMPQAKSYKEDLVCWRKVALKETKAGRDPGKREFLSAEIPAELYYDIANDLLGADEEEVKAIFARPFEDAATLKVPAPSAKAAPDRAAELKLARKIASILRNHWGLVATDIAAGETIDLAELEHLLQAEIMIELADVATNQALLAAEGIGIGFELGKINAAVSEWARQYAYDLVRDLTDTTWKVVSNATTQFVETPGMTIGQLRGLLKPAFGDVRAQMIAVTETTRAFSQGTNIYQEMLTGAGVEMTRIWNTAADEKTCPICWPLEGRPEKEWASEFPTGPPAHVNCRCWTTLTTMPERAAEERWEYVGEEIVAEPSLGKQLQALEPGMDRLQVVGDWLARNKSEAISDILEPGMGVTERMRSVAFDGMRIYFTDLNQQAAQHTIWKLASGKRLPSILTRDLRRIVHTTRLNSQDAYWSKKYGYHFVTKAAGGQGLVVAFGGMPLDRGDILHELGHLFHERVYGSQDHPAKSAFRIATESKWELPPSIYAGNRIEEDFAESVRAYFARPKWFQKQNPARSKVIRELVEAQGG